MKRDIAYAFCPGKFRKYQSNTSLNLKAILLQEVSLLIANVVARSKAPMKYDLNAIQA